MTRLALGLLLIGLCAGPIADTRNTLVVKDAWIPEGPPTSPVVAVYFNIENLGVERRRLLQARRSDGASAAIHRTIERDGVARMSSIDEVIIEPGARIEFAPGGYHLMLDAQQGDYRAGERVRLELQFADGSVIPFQAQVWRRDARSSSGRNAAHEH